MSKVLPLSFDGGLNTSVHESRIGENEVSACSNAIMRDGRIRLDQRYINAGAPGADTVPQGSGWGKYGTGTLSHQYVQVNNTKLYEYDLTAGSPAWAQANTGLAAGDWFWQQFTDYLYGANITDGMGRKKLAAGSNSHGDWGLIAPPTAPGSAPTSAQNQSAIIQTSWSGSTSSASSGTATYVSTTDSYRMVWTSAQAGVSTLEVTYKTAAPDNRPDLSYHDLLRHALQLSTGVQLQQIEVFAGSYILILDWLTLGDDFSSAYVWHRIQNIGRTSRTSVTKIKYTFVVPGSGGNATIGSPLAGGVWLSLGINPNVPLHEQPVFSPLKYVATNYNSTTGLESAPSPALTVPAIQQYPKGEWRTVTGAVSGVSGVDFIRFYRVVEDGSSITYYRLGSVANSGTPAVTDKYTVDEVQAFTVYKPSSVPTSGLTGITTWLNRLVLLAGNTCYISRDHTNVASSTVPAFEPLAGQFDPYDLARGLTFPVDDRLAESGYGIVGQDSLYVVTNYSVRCLYGSTPDNWRYVKIGNEGACGVRAWCPYKSGVLVLTPSGRLLYHEIGIEPVDASEKLRPRIGSTGLKAVATSSAIVAVTPIGEIHVTDSTGLYFIMDIEGRWRSGTWTHPWHSALMVSGLSIRWISSLGKLMQGGDDTYVSDGGTTATNGTAVTYSVTTRKYREPRVSITNVFWGDSSGTPSINITTPRGATGAKAKTSGKRNTQIAVTNNGEGFYAVLTGDKNAIVEEVRLTLEPASEARHL